MVNRSILYVVSRIFHKKYSSSFQTTNKMSQWKNLDLKKLLIPEEIKLKKDSVVVNEGVKKIENAPVFFRESLPFENSKSVSVLLLHGMRFSSKTWLDLGTINFLSAMGYRTVAVDLPGYANTPSAKIESKADFLHSIIGGFGLNNPVIVSPSMSGSFTIPYLVQNWTKIAGYIPVAPVGFDVLENQPSREDKSIVKEVFEPLQEFLYDPVPDLSFIKTPTMVVFGEKDRSRSSALLSLLPNSQSQEIPNGGHPAYLDNPELWHQLLYNFLNVLSEQNLETFLFKKLVSRHK